ncbi:hypothetical protein IJD44_09350 [bacterium]|nr:hypothetical protein [bacterium]
MNIKKFSIYSSIITAVIVIACIVCCFIVIPTPFTFENEPKSITVYNYNKSSKGETVTKNGAYSNYYNTLVKEFQKTTTFTVFERIVSGANIYKKASQDIKQTKPTWSSVKRGVTIEISFQEKESIVVFVDGDSKLIEYYGLAMVVQPSSNVHEVSLYFNTKQDGSYTSSPILIQMKTEKLYKLITTMEFN